MIGAAVLPEPMLGPKPSPGSRAVSGPAPDSRLAPKPGTGAAPRPESRSGAGPAPESRLAPRPGTMPGTGVRPGTGPVNKPAPKPVPGGGIVPAPTSKPVVTDKVRSFDISENGKITKSSARNPDEDEKDLDIGAESFKVNFDFESAYKDVPEEKPMRPRREKRTGCIGGLLYGALVISISLVLATVLWMAAVDVLGFDTSAENEQIIITVPNNFAMEDITEMLFDAGLIKYKFLFKIYTDFSHADNKIKAGSYVLHHNLDYRALVQGMTPQQGARVETTLTIPEGLTLAQIFTLFEDNAICPANDLWEAATNYDFNYSFLDKDTLGDKLRLEGFLFPETHNFYLNSTPVQVLSKLLKEFDNRFTEEYRERAEDMGYSVRDIIIIASMIEREAGDDEERPRIAAVIYNRLNSKDFPNLQIDATIRYAIAGTNLPFSTDIDNPYNTYLREGLPPGPISNPGIASIRAALYPDSTKEYYYALNKDGTHNFFTTRAQHEAFVHSDDYAWR